MYCNILLIFYRFMFIGNVFSQVRLSPTTKKLVIRLRDDSPLSSPKGLSSLPRPSPDALLNIDTGGRVTGVVITAREPEGNAAFISRYFCTKRN